jgi:hypothetical protein
MATFRCRSVSAMAKRKDFTARPCSDVSRQGDAADCSCRLSDRIETYSLKEITPAGASDATYRYSILVDVSCARRRRTVQRSSHRLSSSHRARTGRCSCCAHARRRRGSARGWRSTRRRRGRSGGGGETGSRRRRSRRRAHHQGSCGRWGPITHNRRGALLLPANQPGRRTFRCRAHFRSGRPSPEGLRVSLRLSKNCQTKDSNERDSAAPREWPGLSRNLFTIHDTRPQSRRICSSG